MCNHQETRIRFHSTCVIDTANFITTHSAGANGVIYHKRGDHFKELFEGRGNKVSF